MSGIAAAILGGGALSSLAQIFGTQAAAKAQTSAAQSAINAQLSMFGVQQAVEAPYQAAGINATQQLQGQIPGLISPVPVPTMDQATLEKTPGYQWNLAQGLKATQNGVAARGLGISGAAEKGAASYASGLASSTYGQQFGIAEQQFANQLANKQMTYNTLSGIAGIGESAAANVGAGAQGTGAALGQNLTNIGTAQAGADIGAANAATGFSSALQSNALIAAMLQGRGG